MRILGIDPGLQVTGFGFLEIENGKARCGEAGTIRTTTVPLPQRLRTLFLRLQELLMKGRPDEVAVEEGFYGKNVKVALMLGQARGAVLLACAQSELPIAEYSPREVKQSVVGRGDASKEQVNYMITALLSLSQPPRPNDISDALAVAYTHFQRRERIQ
jgi:crossover junction endodeoxyribonuclease RuvC